MADAEWEMRIDHCDFQGVGRQMIGEMDALTERTARLIHRDAQLAIQNPPKTGRTYKRGKRGRVHQASAKGQAPASDTGALAGNSGETRLAQAEWEVWFAQDYAPILENPNQLDRSFLAPACKKHWPGYVQGIRDIVGAT